MHYIPGQGQKKPLNMLEAPIYPDIKQAPPDFKWSKKFWQVDVGQTLLSTEPHTQLIEDAVLAVSYRDNIDRYGQSSHQEKITVFRPPLQNYYEDFGPLNRLPATIHAIEARINPGTATDSGGTVAFQTNNNQQQDVDRYIQDRIVKDTWRTTYYMPMDDVPENLNSIIPDFETTLPQRSVVSGYESRFNIDAPDIRRDGRKDIGRETRDTRINISGHSGSDPNYRSSTVERVPNIELFELIPNVSAHSGYESNRTVDGESHLNDIRLSSTLPNRSVSSGSNSNITIDGESHLDRIHLDRNLPSTSLTSGYNPISTFDGKTQFENIQLQSLPTTRLNINSPGSETGYQTRINMESNVGRENHIKLRENPQVSVSAHKTFNYNQDNNIQSDRPFFRTKLQPEKSYTSGLNKGTIRTSGVESPKLGSSYFTNKKLPTGRVY